MLVPGAGRETQFSQKLKTFIEDIRNKVPGLPEARPNISKDLFNFLNHFVINISIEININMILTVC